jgi:hypothetical protein
MRIPLSIVVIVICGALAPLSGCKREEAAVPPAADASKPADAVANQATTAVDAAKSTAQAASDQVTSQVKASGQQAQGLIDQTKAYLTDQKYQEAMSSLTKLGGITLTPDQQKTVDDLKTQIQAALAKASTSDAASKLGDALGGKQ